MENKLHAWEEIVKHVTSKMEKFEVNIEEVSIKISGKELGNTEPTQYEYKLSDYVVGDSGLRLWEQTIGDVTSRLHALKMSVENVYFAITGKDTSGFAFTYTTPGFNMDGSKKNKIYTQEELQEMVKSEDPGKRVMAVEHGVGLETLIDDPSSQVRFAVAKRGYYLEKLVNDPDEFVRAIVASKGHRPDVFVNDPTPFVRAKVAEQGYGLETLIDDPHPWVREAARKAKAELNY